MHKQVPPPLPGSERSLVAVVATIAVAVFVALIIMLLWVSASSSGGATGTGNSQANSDGRNAQGQVGDSENSTTSSNGVSGGSESGAPPSDSKSFNGAQTQQGVASIAAPAPLSESESSTESDLKAASSTLPRTYEFFTQRGPVGSSPVPASDVGREADFFGVAAGGRDFVYVVDKSSSMSGERFEMARDELLRSLNKLKPNQRFFVIFYDDVAYPQPSTKLVTARVSNVRRMSNWVMNATSQGGTAPMDAIERAISFEPDAIFVLSDGEFDQSVVTETARLNEDNPVQIHTIGFQNDAETLRAIAEENNGTYRFVP